MSRPRDVDALLRRRLALLERIEALGSIAKAAKAVGITYKAAWDAVAALDAASDSPLVERSAGGSGGGGARLTPAGARLVAAFRTLDAARLRQLSDLAGRAGALAPLAGWLRRLSMRTSARNQFYGKVAAIKRGAVDAEVALSLPGGDRLTAVVTNDSVDALGLRRGAEAFALVKASWVLLAAGAEAPRLSAANIFAGTVSALRTGPVSCEVSVRLPGGAPLVAVVTRESARGLALAAGRPVWAVVNPASVIVGVHA